MPPLVAPERRIAATRAPDAWGVGVVSLTLAGSPISSSHNPRIANEPTVAPLRPSRRRRRCCVDVQRLAGVWRTGPGGIHARLPWHVHRSEEQGDLRDAFRPQDGGPGAAGGGGGDQESVVPGDPSEP